MSECPRCPRSSALAGRKTKHKESVADEKVTNGPRAMVLHPLCNVVFLTVFGNYYLSPDLVSPLGLAQTGQEWQCEGTEDTRARRVLCASSGQPPTTQPQPTALDGLPDSAPCSCPRALSQPNIPTAAFYGKMKIHSTVGVGGAGEGAMWGSGRGWKHYDLYFFPTFAVKITHLHSREQQSYKAPILTSAK